MTYLITRGKFPGDYFVDLLSVDDDLLSVDEIVDVCQSVEALENSLIDLAGEALDLEDNSTKLQVWELTPVKVEVNFSVLGLETLTSTKKPSKATKKPSKATKKPSKATKKPSKAAKKPSKAAKKSAQAVRNW